MLKNSILKLFSFKLIRYGFIGVVSTLIHFSVAYLYIYYINNSLYQSNIIAFFTAYIFSYFMQTTYVFGHKVNLNKAFKYFIVQLGSLLISIVLSDLLKYNTYIKTVVVIILMPLITYTIHKLWTFKEENE